MFGTQQASIDEWSTDDEGEYDEEEEEDGEFLGDDYYDDYPPLTDQAGNTDPSWSNSRQAAKLESRSSGGSVVKESLKESGAEEEKRQRLARKRAEKRKKQKGKKTTKDAVFGNDEYRSNNTPDRDIQPHVTPVAQENIDR